MEYVYRVNAFILILSKEMKMCSCHLSLPNLNRLNLREFVTTDTELNAMAPAAIMGFSRPSAAKGIARTL